MKKHGHIWFIHQKGDDELAKKGYQDLIALVGKESE